MPFRDTSQADLTLLIRVTLSIVFVTCVCPASHRDHRHRSPSTSVFVTGSKNGKLALPWIFYHRFLAGFSNPNIKPGAPWNLSEEESSGIFTKTACARSSGIL